MPIYDEDWNIVENPDMEIGDIANVPRGIYHIYTLEDPGSWHEEVLVEYPNGGKDVEIVWDEEPVGYWTTYDAKTDKRIDYKFVNTGWPEEDGFMVEDSVMVDVYRFLDPDEIDERKRWKEEFEAEQKKKENQQALLDDMPDLLCTLYEQSLSQQETIDNQNEILCLMYEKMLEGGE